jgi:hypothetical protein
MFSGSSELKATRFTVTHFFLSGIGTEDEIILYILLSMNHDTQLDVVGNELKRLHEHYLP